MVNLNILFDYLATFSDFVTNAVVLFALVFIYALTNLDPKNTKINHQVYLGIIIGVFTILVMMTGWTADDGSIYDTRSILISITGLFFGPITTIIASAIAIIYRGILGNNGVISGILTIIVSAGFGLSWRRIRMVFPKMPLLVEYFVFSLVVHMFVLMCFITILPFGVGIERINETAFSYLTIFPIVSMILSLSLYYQRKRIDNANLINKQKILLQSSIDANLNVEIYALDRDYCYLSFNQTHAKAMKMFYGVTIEKEKSFFNYLDNDRIAERLKNTFDKVLQGEAIKSVLEIETQKGKYLEEIYTPIKNEKHEVVGLTVFSQDVTQQKTYEESILFMSLHDPLTGLMNRRYLTNYFREIEFQKEILPLTIVQADINGLKIMNDAFGHEAGDELLVAVATVLKDVFMQKENIARNGGDEFVIVLENTTKERGLTLIEKAEKQLESMKIHGMHVSVSFGIATKYENETLTDVVRIAEEDMYQHKLFEISSQRNESIKTIIKTLNEKNPREEAHSARVAELCVQIGRKLGMKTSDINLLRVISNLHDIGKIAIDSSILNKPAGLTKDEWESIKKHPEIGYRILATSPEYAEIAYDILSHHERFDGKGYPRGLKGEDIPYRARIIAVADAYDAMTSQRTYKKQMTTEEAIDELVRNSGSQFDPGIVSAFISVLKDSDVSL